ncbi:hypothetical protein P9246_17675 [Aeribacillus pallidus]|uniref:Uncharacterized protein n=1 Tax=Aeribacillus phage AP45 TaxID=1913112 RepID=A0A1L2K2J5_9CAUD|nr:hypothetical protein HWD36_gp03 [Aeribacillus phage AP45]APC46452.1 hypothetical protein [Aeribacillus phage AP45]MED0649740.1 hypothetical protein [Aeribacillus composti]MED4488543.1 hypothetical protein [Aeribacillus pallidus]
MAKIGFIVVSNDAFNHNGEIIIKKPFASLNPYNIPGEFSFTVSFSMFNLLANKDHNFIVKIISPNGNNVFKTNNINFRFDPKENVHAAVININFNNVLFKETGIHKISVTIDDENTKEIEIPVFPRKQGDDLNE